MFLSVQFMVESGAERAGKGGESTVEKLHGFSQNAISMVDDRQREVVGRKLLKGGTGGTTTAAAGSAPAVPGGAPPRLNDQAGLRQFLTRELGMNFTAEDERAMDPDLRPAAHGGSTQYSEANNVAGATSGAGLTRDDLRIVTVLEADVQCPICCEALPIKSKAKEFPVCKHLFHDECIMKQLDYMKECPLCRCDPLAGARTKHAGGFGGWGGDEAQRRVREEFAAGGTGMYG